MANKSLSFKLNEKSGVTDARKILEQWGADAAVLLLFGPIGLLVSRWLAAPSSEEQAKIANKLIETGKTQGVKHMKITCDRGAQGGIGVGVKGAEVKLSAGSRDTVIVNVEYK